MPHRQPENSTFIGIFEALPKFVPKSRKLIPEINKFVPKRFQAPSWNDEDRKNSGHKWLQNKYGQPTK
jgi:hypothetical protein